MVPQLLSSTSTTDGDTTATASEAHEPASFTVLSFQVQDIEATVDELTAKGVPFQRYDGFDQDKRGTASMRADPYRGSPILRGTSLQS